MKSSTLSSCCLGNICFWMQKDLETQGSRLMMQKAEISYVSWLPNFPPLLLWSWEGEALCCNIQKERAGQQSSSGGSQENLATPVQWWHWESIWLCVSSHYPSVSPVLSAAVSSCRGSGGPDPMFTEGTKGQPACHLWSFVQLALAACLSCCFGLQLTSKALVPPCKPDPIPVAAPWIH